MQCCITDLFFFEKNEEILRLEISLEELVSLSPSCFCHKT